MASKQESKGKQTEDKQPKAEAKQSKAAQQSEDTQEHKETASSKAVAPDATGVTEDDKQELESLLETLQGDLSAIDPEAGLSLIDEWYGQLHKSKDEGIKELASGLKELKQALKGNKATGHEIGELLAQVGEQTQELASDADKGFKTTLQKLGKQLTKVGNSLGKAEDQEHVEHVESLIELLESDDLSELDSEEAIASIDEWYAMLHKSEDETQKEIANSLKQLKQALSGKGKGTNLGELLTQLGEQTTEAAADAQRGLKGPIQRLGKLLSKTGKSISSES